MCRLSPLVSVRPNRAGMSALTLAGKTDRKLPKALIECFPMRFPFGAFGRPPRKAKVRSGRALFPMHFDPHCGGANQLHMQRERCRRLDRIRCIFPICVAHFNYFESKLINSTRQQWRQINSKPSAVYPAMCHMQLCVSTVHRGGFVTGIVAN